MTKERLYNILIEEIMTKEVRFISENAPIWDAHMIMKMHGVRHIPVVDDEKNIVGLFTQTDLNSAYSPKETEAGHYYDRGELMAIKLAHYMTKNPEVLTPKDAIGKAASVMARNKYNCLLIVEPGTRKLCGIITSVDILKKIALLFIESKS